VTVGTRDGDGKDSGREEREFEVGRELEFPTSNTVNSLV